MNPEIRAFAVADLPSVVELSLRAWAPVFQSLEQVFDPPLFKHFYPEGWRASQEKDVSDVCASPDFQTWVATSSGAVAGFVALRLNTRDRMGEIYMIAVDPDYQRRGIAAALTQFALDRMKDAGMAVAMVETGGDPGHAPARATYEHMGFGLFPVARYFRKL